MLYYVLLYKIYYVFMNKNRRYIHNIMFTIFLKKVSYSTLSLTGKI